MFGFLKLCFSEMVLKKKKVCYSY